jgi:putative oxidoreductase
MQFLKSIHNQAFGVIETYIAPIALPTLARFIFAASLLGYYINSGLTKIIDRRGNESGILDYFTLESGVYAQMFPRAFEAAGYDPSQLGVIYTLIAIAGTVAEFVLPVLIVIGLMTRLAALGMIGFVVVQTWVDVTGHGAEFGAWFDRLANGVIDERGFWVLALLILVFKGAGPIAVDAVFRRQKNAPFTS